MYVIGWRGGGVRKMDRVVGGQIRNPRNLTSWSSCRTVPATAIIRKDSTLVRLLRHGADLSSFLQQPCAWSHRAR